MENKYGKGRKRRGKTAKTAAALLAGLVIAVIFMYGIRHITDDRFYVPSLWAIKSDSPGVEWIREGERVVQVKIEGRFPYCFIIPDGGYCQGFSGKYGIGNQDIHIFC